MTVVVEGPAKVNLSLQVRSRDSSGMHPLRSIVQMVSWCDVMEVAPWDEDTLRIEPAQAEVPEGGDNLIWKAAAWHRALVPSRHPNGVVLHKTIPVAAGLGGGSADAAAMLVALDELDGRVGSAASPAEIGSDVPFALAGGSAWMEGYGEVLARRTTSSDYALVIAVPPLALSTPEVYARWDRLDEPTGPALAGRSLPPSLRGEGPLVNDLYAAAVSLAPDLPAYRSELRDLWGREVAMSGSGPSLFAYFADLDEAESAAGDIAAGFRAMRAVRPVDHGARILEIRDG